MTLSRRKRVLFGILGVAIVLATSEALSLVAIRLTWSALAEPIRTTRAIYRDQSAQLRRLLTSDSGRLLVLDPLLGWRYRAGHRDPENAMNSKGLRSLREYAPHPAPGTLRVAAFGDSFVYGNEVSDSGAWPALMERLFPRMEVLNYGVGGYGVDQAFLRFCSEGTALSPDVVIIGFVRDDLRRVVNVYRRFISNLELPLVKPRFALDGADSLVLLPNPAPHPSDYERYLRGPRRVIELGAHDQWYRAAVYENPLYDYSATVRLLTNLWLRSDNRYLAADRLIRDGELNPSSPAFRIQVALFERFAAAAHAAGARPIVVLFPDRKAVMEARDGRRRAVVAPLIERLTERYVELIDLMPAFLEPGLTGDVNTWFMSGGHYSAAGNRMVAEWLGNELARTPARRRLIRNHDPAATTLARACPAGTVGRSLPSGGGSGGHSQSATARAGGHAQ